MVFRKSHFRVDVILEVSEFYYVKLMRNKAISIYKSCIYSIKHMPDERERKAS